MQGHTQGKVCKGLMLFLLLFLGFWWQVCYFFFVRDKVDFTKKKPRITTLECPGCPSLRALTFGTLGLIKGGFFYLHPFIH